MIDESAIRLRFATLDPVLDERGRRRFAAAEALSAGRGGIAAVSRATGLARSTIGRALSELRGGEKVDGERVRRAGGGRKPVSETDASLVEDLRSLLEPTTRGDPQSPLLWTCKSLRKLSQSLRDMGHTVGRTVVGDLLRKFDYSLQSNGKTREGSNHPDRDAQFLYINDRGEGSARCGPWIPERSATRLREADMDIFSKLGKQGLEWRLKPEAFAGREVGRQDDLLDVLVGCAVDIEVARQPST
jgi:Rhodopirellula transposase DDE domain